MQLVPSITQAQASLHAASQKAAEATYVTGSSRISATLLAARAHVSAAEDAIEQLPNLDTPCQISALHSIAGVRAKLNTALEVARTVDPGSGELPLGLVDPLLDQLEDAGDKLFASRWG